MRGLAEDPDKHGHSGWFRFLSPNPSHLIARHLASAGLHSLWRQRGTFQEQLVPAQNKHKMGVMSFSFYVFMRCVLRRPRWWPELIRQLVFSEVRPTWVLSSRGACPCVVNSEATSHYQRNAWSFAPEGPYKSHFLFELELSGSGSPVSLSAMSLALTHFQPFRDTDQRCGKKQK